MAEVVVAGVDAGEVAPEALVAAAGGGVGGRWMLTTGIGFALAAAGATTGGASPAGRKKAGAA